MAERTLTNAETARLKDAGIEYPWSPRQSLGLLDMIQALETERDRFEKMYLERHHAGVEKRSECRLLKARVEELEAEAKRWKGDCNEQIRLNAELLDEIQLHKDRPPTLDSQPREDDGNDR